MPFTAIWDEWCRPLDRQISLIKKAQRKKVVNFRLVKSDFLKKYNFCSRCFISINNFDDPLHNSSNYCTASKNALYINKGIKNWAEKN